MRLARLAGDENEAWRGRTTWLFIQDEVRETPQEQLRELMLTHNIEQQVLEATAYFEAHQAWEELSELLDGYGLWLLFSGQNREMLKVIEERLRIKNLSRNERNDAIGMYLTLCLALGDYMTVVDRMLEILKALGADEPIEAFGGTISNVMWAASLCGRWHETVYLAKRLEEARTRTPEKTQFVMIGGYMALLAIALARENRAEIDARLATVQRIAPSFSPANSQS